MTIETYKNKKIIGRAEWITLQGLHMPPLLARIDSGAKTSSLHAYEITEYDHKGELWVKFKTRPKTIDTHSVIQCKAKVITKKMIKSSNGERQCRYVIETESRMGGEVRGVQFTLSNRKKMRFRVLIGRRTIGAFNFLVDVQKRTVLEDYSKHSPSHKNQTNQSNKQ